MITAAPAISSRHLEGAQFPHKFFDLSKITPDHASRIDVAKLQKEGIIDYKLDKSSTPGIEITEHKIVPESTLIWQRRGRIAATIGAVALNVLSALGLFYSGAKLFINSFGKGNVGQSYKSLGNAYAASAVAGALTGAAHESPEWAIGNIGMGFFSRYLEKIWGLAGFSISEGLASIGMGRVKYRDKQNVYAVRNSIFNNPKLAKLRFLMPIEQSIISFAKRLISPKSWIRFKKEEPYALFQTAGGGLISAGGILGLASLFKNKMSETLRSFFYLPYSLLSVANLVAFYRDGDQQLERAKDFGSRKPGETYSMKGEGYCKEIATPFLAINNLLLALKGLGIDSKHGMMYNLAMAARSWGAALAFLGFTFHSAIKFFKPDLFGPLFKEVVKFKLNPVKAGKAILEYLKRLDKTKPEPHVSDRFDAIIYDGSNEQREILDKLIKTNTFQGLREKTQIGLPTPCDPPSDSRAYLERFNHSKRVCAISILIYDALLKNTTDPNLKKYLLENKDAFKLAGLLHDIGHVARSHFAEKAAKGHNNDEHTVEILKGTNPDVPKDICDTVLQHYGKKRGEEVLQGVRDIIGRWSPLYKAFKISDYTEYTRCGDFSEVAGFPKWTIDEIKDYADTVRLYKDKDGKVQTGFTEKGALLTFILFFDRKVFNDSYNYDPLSQAEEYPYLLGLDAADVSGQAVKKMKESELDEATHRGLAMLEKSNFQFRTKLITGGETAYSGYSKVDPERKIMVVGDDKAEPIEFLEHLEKVIKPRDKKLYQDLQPRVIGLTTPKEINLTIDVSSN